MRKFDAELVDYDEEQDMYMFYAVPSEGIKFPYLECSFADWKATEEGIAAGAEQGAKGAEVVILQDGSDTYIVASMFDAVPI